MLPRPAARAIGAFLDEIVEVSLSDPARRGCLLVNTALDGAQLPAEARALVRECLGEIEAFFRGKLGDGQADGTIPVAIEPADMAESLLGTVLAIRVLARLDPEPGRLHRLVRTALAPLAIP